MKNRVEADIDLDAIEYNIKKVKSLNPPERKTLLVIKADAYGHGAAVIARQMDSLADYFGVACIDEALELRAAGIVKPILILGHADREDYEALIENDITLSIYDEEDAKVLSEAAVRLGKNARIHLKADTGMRRIGFSTDEEGISKAAKCLRLPKVDVEGIFSHFAKADEKDKTAALEQQRRLKSFIDSLEARYGANFKIKHLDNSAGAMELHTEGFDMMRLGIVIYGLYPSEEIDRSIDIKPAMTFKSKVVFVKDVAEGDGISYGWTCRAERPLRVATVCAGYADGYPRAQSGTGEVLVHGRRAKILGRVCMDQFMIDVTDIPDVMTGDEVVLFGRQGAEEISVEEVASPANSFNYELVCNISRRVPRVYFRGGRAVEKVNYLR